MEQLVGNGVRQGLQPPALGLLDRGLQRHGPLHFLLAAALLTSAALRTGMEESQYRRKMTQAKERAAQVPFSIRATERPRRPWQARSRRKFSIGV